MSQHIQTIESREGFEALVRESEVPVVVDFWAPWCGPCQALGPVLEEVAAELGDRAVIAKVNVDDHPTLAREHGITSIPTLLTFEGSELQHRESGLVYKDTIVARTEAYLPQSV